MHIDNSDRTTLRVASLAAVLALHAGTYSDADEIAADAAAIITAVNEADRLRGEGKRPLEQNKLILELAEKHCAYVKFGPKRGRISGLRIPRGSRHEFIAVL